MAMPLRSLLVPGVGSAKKALTSINKLRNDMHECEELYGRVLCRLLETYKQLRDMEKQERAVPRDVLDQYARLLGSCVVLMKKHPSKPLYERVLRQRETLQEIHALHEELDGMTHALGISTVAWKERWKDDIAAHTALLRLVIDNRECVEYETGNLQAQIEAMTVLQFELERRGEESTQDEREMIEKLCEQIQMVTEMEAPVVPEWFVPSSDVIFDSKPYTQSSNRSFHSATWNTRKVVVMVLTARAGVSSREKLMETITDLRQLSHPFVASILGANHVASPPFILLDVTGHSTLAMLLETLEEDHELIKWNSLYQAAIGLEYLHDNGMVHGDLTLDSILIEDDSHAQLVGPVASVLTTRAASLRWRAPECLEHRPTCASDVYSLGQCILQAATGEPPFAHLDDAMVYCFVRDGKTLPRPEAAPEKVWQLIQAMTDHDPLERCSLDSVIVALEEMAQDAAAGRANEARHSIAVATVEDVVQFGLRRVSVQSGGASSAPTSDEESCSEDAYTDDSDGEIDEEIASQGEYSDDGYESCASGDTEGAAIIPLRGIRAARRSKDFVSREASGSTEYPAVHGVLNGDSPSGREGTERAPTDITDFEPTKMDASSFKDQQGQLVTATASEEEPAARGCELTPIAVSSVGLQHTQQTASMAGVAAQIVATDGKEPPISGAGGIGRLVSLLQSDESEKRTRAARALRYLATVVDNHEAIVQAGAIAALVQALEDQTVGVAIASEALLSLAGNAANDAVFETSIEQLVVMIGRRKHPSIPSAARVLGTLASRDANRQKIVAAGGIAALIQLAWGRECGGEEQLQSACVHNRLASNPYIRVVILLAGGLAPLIVLALCGTSAQQTAAKSALETLVQGESGYEEPLDDDSAMCAIVISMVRDGNDQQKKEAATALSILCREIPTRAAIVRAGAIPQVVALARDGDDKQRAEAAWTMVFLECEEAYHHAIVHEGGIEALVLMLRKASTVYDQFSGLHAIARFAEDDDLLNGIVQHGGIEALVGVLGDSYTACEASPILLKLSSTASYGQRIVEAGGIAPLLKLLHDDDEKVRSHACALLSNLACDESNRLKIVHAGGIGPLIDIVRTTSGEIETVAAGTLVSLMKDSEVRRAVRESDDMNALQELANSGSADHAETHRALLKAMRCEIM